MIRTFDVIFYDCVGMPYRGTTPEEMGLGGSEFAAIQVAEGLARTGLSVAILNNWNGSPTVDNGVLYYPWRLARADKWSCKTLVVQRYSGLPSFVYFDRVALAVHDKPGHEAITNQLFEEYPDTTLIAVSHWQRSLYPAAWPAVVIPNIVPDAVYNRASLPCLPGHFLYASGASRGLDESIRLWSALRKYEPLQDSRLAVCAPSYDPLPALRNRRGLSFLGSLPFSQLLDQIAGCEGLLYFNTNPETFCLLGAFTEAMGRKTHIYPRYGDGALREVLTSPLIASSVYEMASNVVRSYKSDDPKWLGVPKDYRAATILPRWLAALGFANSNAKEDAMVARHPMSRDA